MKAEHENIHEWIRRIRSRLPRKSASLNVWLSREQLEALYVSDPSARQRKLRASAYAALRDRVVRFVDDKLSPG